MKKILLLLTTLTLTGATLAYGQDHDHDHDEELHLDSSGLDAKGDDHHNHKEEGHGHEEKGEGHDEHGEEGAAADAELTNAQRRMAGIETQLVKRQSLGEAITAPGEVTLNAYRTTKVTPRIGAQVLMRHARLGDHVKKGQPLVTLSGVQMAEAQGVLMEADVELRRVEKLGRKVVSEKRFVAAQIAYQQAYAKVSAYGMTTAQIDEFIRLADATKANGEFILLSYQDGTVISDDFVVGEIVEPGRVLLEISDESLLWVVARLTPEDVAGIAIGAAARIKTGESWLPGKVVQARHTLDETTRTLALHVEVANPDDALHPGQFVNVVIEGKQKQRGIVVPLAAVMRSPDGDWQVLVESAPGRFEPKEVEVLRTVGDQMLIEGIAEGTTIVSKGAFFVQSEIAKSGFSVHNH